ncbi:MAG TPA: flagellar basal body P-ring protein FlgI, partial [Gemmataceae bacterium]
MNQARLVLAAVLVGLTGCLTPPTTPRSQSEDADTAGRHEVQTVGDITAFSNTDPIPVSGVGLVYNLAGTGHSPPGTYREMLETELKRDGFENAREILDSPNQALVLVSAVIPPGARKGDPLDVVVTLPQGSKTRSLRGGILAECRLHTYNTPASMRADRLLLGNTLARAKGPLVLPPPKGAPADPDPAGDAAPGESELTAQVWGGGVCLENRPLYLVMNLGYQRSRLTADIAGRVNMAFQGPGPGDELAVAKTNEVIWLNVPARYRLNLPRFMRAVRMVPIKAVPENHPYRYRLEQEVLDPAHAVTAALRLEALGPGSVKALKPGLQSASPLVRFACAEALAYLGEPCCGEELARLAVEYPILQAYCLTALGSLNEAVSFVKLQELLACDRPEVRYGAFRALRELDERADAVRGERLNDSFWLHRVAPHSPPLVHMLTGKRAEVVLFGEAPRLNPPFSYLVGRDFTVTAGVTDDRCTVSRFSVHTGTDRRQCSTELAEILRTLAEMGATYADVVDLLRQADEYRSLSCPLAVDAMPGGVDVETLAELGRRDPNLTRADPALLKAGGEEEAEAPG